MATLKTIKNFRQTTEMATVTFCGWDGKTYDGEGRNLRVWLNAEHPGKRFVRCNFRSEGYGTVTCFHLLTGKAHPQTGVEIAEFFTDID